jgi:O-antigen ligase
MSNDFTPRIFVPADHWPLDFQPHRSLTRERQHAGKMRLGTLYILLTPLAAGIGCMQGIDLGPLAYTGVMWMGMLAAGVAILMMEKATHRGPAIAMPYRPWLVWIGYLWFSLAWCSPLAGRNIQDALQLTSPLIVGVLASLFIRTPENVARLLKSFWLALVPIGGGVALWKLGLIDGGEEMGALGISPRVMALTLCLIGAVCVTAWPSKKLLPLVGWGLCLLLTFVTGSRMATAALLTVPILHPLYRSRTLRLGMIAGVLVLAVVLFHTKVFQERFFYSGSGTLTDLFEGNFLGFGRFVAWPTILEDAWRKPILGSGVGTVFTYVPTVWDDMTHAHNDYLRIGYELGLVGLAIFLPLVVWQLASLKRLLPTTTGPVRCAAAAGMIGLLLFLITAVTDNPLIYNLWFMNPLFAVIGAAYGAARGLHPTDLDTIAAISTAEESL